jgi:dephospho-CoA kinase
MIIAGITGGIGSGKTTCCKIFELLGVPVYYADDEAKKLLSDPNISKQITDIFGVKILVDARIDRKLLAAQVFKDPEKLSVLNSIIHPAVKEHFTQWCAKHNNASLVLKEAAILFESGTYKNVDRIITVTAPLEMRIERSIKRDKVSREEVESRISKQLSDEEKIKRSDYIIVNDESTLLIPQIVDLQRILNGIN